MVVAVVPRMWLWLLAFFEYVCADFLFFESAPGRFAVEGDGDGVSRTPSLAWLHDVLQLHRMMAPAGVIIPALAGGTRGGETLARVSLKPERAFNVIAHDRDREHAETVRRRCLRTV